MPQSQSQRDVAIRLLRQEGIMRLSELKRQGIDPPTLARLIEDGVVVRPARGLYELGGVEVAAAHSLAEVTKRAPRAVVCLISALQFHDVTLQSPRSVWLAIGSKDRAPRITHVTSQIVRLGQSAMKLGVETHAIDRVAVRIFDPARTVVDCFRFRRRVGLDVALEALRLALRSRKASPDAIAAYARELRIWTVVRPYLESVVADDA